MANLKFITRNETLACRVEYLGIQIDVWEFKVLGGRFYRLQSGVNEFEYKDIGTLADSDGEQLYKKDGRVFLASINDLLEHFTDYINTKKLTNKELKS